MSFVQMNVIGAMQRSHPGLTDLWLKWTGIPLLSQTEFGIMKYESMDGPQGPPGTFIRFPADPGTMVSWASFCDLVGSPPDSYDRRQMPLTYTSTAPQHEAFWRWAIHRELQEVDGPLEWWWRLLVVRRRGIKPASRVLFRQVFGTEDLAKGVLVLPNDTIKQGGRTARDTVLPEKVYRQPNRFQVVFPGETKCLSFSLSDDNLRGTFVRSLLSLATTSSV